MEIKKDVDNLINDLISDVNPEKNVKDFLSKHKLAKGNTYLVAIGKAGYSMAKAASEVLKDKIYKGVVITKYGHSKSELTNIKIFEAGHPIMDENSVIASNYALKMSEGLKEDDEVIFLISGGGSALFESPKVDLSLLQDINSQLLKSGANIYEINTIRKRLSNVKAGRFALHCFPAKVCSIILSDVLGDDLSTIASGPAAIDVQTSEDALNIVDKYNLNITDEVKELLKQETPKELNNVESNIIGSVSILCESTKDRLEKLGYQCEILNDKETSEAKTLGQKIGELVINKQDSKKSIAYIVGGETVVVVKGNGLGGRNQEFALSTLDYLKDCKDTCVFGFGSDGSDGPTDAAGGYVDDKMYQYAIKHNIDYKAYLENNDAYHCLEKLNGLIKTGPTGTNVNDVYVLMIKR